MFDLSVPGASILFVDDVNANDVQEERPHATTSFGRTTHWKVRSVIRYISGSETDGHHQGLGYALLAEIAELDMKFENNTNSKSDDPWVPIPIQSSFLTLDISMVPGGHRPNEPSITYLCRYNSSSGCFFWRLNFYLQGAC